MRIVTALLVCLFIASGSLTAQTSNTLLAVKFVDANTVVASGSTGTIVRSGDAGASWSVFSTGTTDGLAGLAFANSQVGIIVGGSASLPPPILRTANGGGSWTSTQAPLSGGASSSLRAASCPDGSVWYAAGRYDKIVRTADGGNTWQQLPNITSELITVYGMHFIDANTGIVVGGSTFTTQTTFRTTNGGANWTNIPNTTSTLRAVDFVDASTGYAVGNVGTVVRTVNGGVSWTTLTSGTTTNVYQAVSFPDANVGYVVGWGGTIVKTTNGGASWTSQSSGTTRDLYGVSFRDANTGVAVGSYGTILRTTNGGATWGPPSGGGGGGNPPAAPTLASPANGSTGQPTTLTLNWNSSSGATSYRLQVSTVSNFSSTVYDNSSITGTSQSVGGLSNGTVHYWRVNAGNNDGTSAWSSVWSFTTAAGGSAPAAPTLASPSNGATNQPTTLNLSWNSSSGATTYRLQVSPNSNFSSTVYDNSTSSTSQSVGGLANGTTYYWRANAGNSFGTSGWSSVWSFTTSPMTGVPDFAVSPSSLDFGTIPTKTTKTLSVTVSNPGSATLVVSGISSSSGFFSVSPTSLSVPANGSQNVDITFKPKNKNLVTATITFDHNAPNSPGAVSVSGRGGGTIRGQGTTTSSFPEEVELVQNYPNPFNPSTEIEFFIPEDSRVKLSVYNMIGQEVDVLVDEILTSGYHGVSWNAVQSDGSGLPSGIYIYRLHTISLGSGEVVTRAGKMQFVK